MRRFVTLNCLVDCNDTELFTSDVIQNLRQAVLAPVAYTPKIQQALQRVNFKYHRTCSFSNLIKECNAGEGETLLMFWGYERSDSKVTISMSASSCSSLHLPTSTPSCQRDKELRSTAQQTDISCRYSPGIASPTTPNETEEQRQLRARIADSLTFSSPASSLLQPAGRSMSILSSVCALLLNKQVRDPFEKGSQVAKEVSSFTGSLRSDNICRICFGGESAERLVRPCSCRGTIAAVHRTCLERWLLQAATSYCELCRHHYVVTRSHKWSWMRSMAEWAMSGRGRALAADVWRALALGTASVLGTARALHACDAVLQAGARRGGGAALAANLFSSLLIGVIGALNGLLTTWMLLKIQEHQLSWQAWRDSTLHVHVTLADEESTLTPHTSDATVVGDEDGNATADRSTNVADPFMVALPYTLPDP
ncbi:E3 ubiquitin-protein ligase MARCH1-like isoform X1 [Trichoplusia ni]|uniref:E3 ubiquitin-protein ligase MARCH1-like isoform X1 n=1 Tax=Trichoplusia ni TaxID=7111 RepID=A0A7E5WE33_TRINI|nr:E3 ubiquitin-protein ligase MARCH1-like isoform X1 [Trichoplusia ni]